jgi:hypothetical protein
MDRSLVKPGYLFRLVLQRVVSQQDLFYGGGWRGFPEKLSRPHKNSKGPNSSTSKLVLGGKVKVVSCARVKGT